MNNTETFSVNINFWSLAWSATKYTCLFLACGAFVVLTSFFVVWQYEVARAWSVVQYDRVIAALTRVEVQYVRPVDVPLPDLIQRIAHEHKLHPVVLKAIVLQESSGGKTDALYNFEPHIYAARANRDSRFNEDERRMLASSHGITHIMGFRAQPDCGVHWSKLYDPAVALNCTAKIMRSNLTQQKNVKEPAARLRAAFRMYNGAGLNAERYADRMMSRVGALLFNAIKENL